MLIKALIPVAACLFASVALAESSGFALRAPTQISLDRAPFLLEQCSRSSPRVRGDIWLPSAGEVAQLEADLMDRIVGDDWMFQNVIPLPYSGQYVGFARGPYRYIYASYVAEGSRTWETHTAGQEIVVCDGGRSFWGVVYEPANRTFREVNFNGN